MEPKQKVFFHVDVNSAFLSWSAVKRLKAGETQDLRQIPAVVGGDEEKRHGVVLAKSIPAKKYGIHTGESLFAARAKYPGILVVPPDFDWYVANSKALMEILGQYTPDVEQYSIDEAFLDMTGTEGLSGTPMQAAETIRGRVKRELGFTVNIGISSNRLLAKMASDFEKPDKIHTLWPDEIAAKMWPLPVGDLFGVGPKAKERLNSAGIYTIGRLAALQRSAAEGMFGVRGSVLWEYANGIESEPMTKDHHKDASYGNSTTLPKDLGSPAEADAVLLSLAESVGARLRCDGKSAGVITVQLVDNAFHRRSHQCNLPGATNVTQVIYRTAARLLREFWPERPVRLVGITAEKVCEESFEQLDLFTDATHNVRQEKLDKAADALRARFGEKAVVRAKLLDGGSVKGALAAAKARDKQGLAPDATPPGGPKQSETGGPIKNKSGLDR